MLKNMQLIIFLMAIKKFDLFVKFRTIFFIQYFFLTAISIILLCMFDFIFFVFSYNKKRFCILFNIKSKNNELFTYKL